ERAVTFSITAHISNQQSSVSPPPLKLRRGRLLSLDLVSPRERLFRLHEVLHLPLELELLRRRRRRWWRLVRRDPHVPVILEPGAGRDQAAHRDVLLQAAQVIDLTGNGRLGEHARRFLERR